MSIFRIPEYPIQQEHEPLEAYVKRLRDRLQEEAGERAVDFAYPHTSINVSAYLSSNQENIPHATITTIHLDSVSYDVANTFDASNHKVVIPHDGYYLVTAQIAWVGGTVVADKIWGTLVFKGESAIVATYAHSPSTDALRVIGVKHKFFSSGDEITLRAYHGAGVDTPDIRGNSLRETYMDISLLSV